MKVNVAALFPILGSKQFDLPHQACYRLLVDALNQFEDIPFYS